LSCNKKRGREWKKGGRKEWRLGGDLGDLGGRRELKGIYSITVGK